jgi:hypothetical protein
MKYVIFTLMGSLLSLSTLATPLNLYEQLCEVNQEWRKYRPLAETLGLPALPTIQEEQELLVRHIQLLGQIFATRFVENLTYTQRQARQQHLKVLEAYWKRRDCPHNYYLPYRNPVFIDHEGRYCAVGYLMLKSGKQTFCEAVQKTNNFVFIRQIEHPEFHAWQQESGLSIDELAWIQPGYAPEVRFIDWDKREALGKLHKFDSLTSMSIYNPFYDMRDMFSFDRMFWDIRKDAQTLFKKYRTIYKGTEPSWEKLGGVVAVTVYKNEVFVAVDSSTYIEKGSPSQQDTIIRQSRVVKWNKKTNDWQTVIDLKGERTVYCFFESRGRLYAGGNSPYKECTKEMIVDGKKETYTGYLTSSFLASTSNGTDWKISPQEFGGIIFGLVYKNKKRYLGVVYNNMSGSEKGADLKE